MKYRCVALVVALLVGGRAAQAAPILFTDRAAFDAAVGDHTLYTDFPVTFLPEIAFATGTYGGVSFIHEITDFYFGETLGIVGQFAAGNAGRITLNATIVTPVRAVGFDVLFAKAATGPDLFPPIIDTVLLFTIQTLAGEQASLSLLPGSFIGALLEGGDTLTRLSLSTDAGCMCHTGFAIDNLDVGPGPQVVPESATAVLLGLGLFGLTRVRGRRRC